MLTQHRNAMGAHVLHLAREERVSEIARMLSGERLSDTTLAHAREMLTTAPSAKQG